MVEASVPMRGMPGVRRARTVLRHDFIRFAVVGGANTLMDLAVFTGLHYGVGMASVASKLVSATCATVFSYLMTRWWAFSHRQHDPKAGTVVLFALINVIGISLSVGAVGLVRYGLERRDFLALTIVANALGIVAGMLWRYWSLRRWVFRGHVDGGVR